MHSDSYTKDQKQDTNKDTNQDNYQNNNIILSRDCEGILIPHGLPITMIKGEEVTIMQQLGGSFTVYYNGNLARIDGKDADAIGLEIPGDYVASDYVSDDDLTNSSDVVNYSKFKKVNKPIVGQGLVDEQEVWEQLKKCYDPEIPVNIVDLGLIYDVDLIPIKSNEHIDSIGSEYNQLGMRAEIKMTLTAPGCGMGPYIVDDVYSKVLAVDNILEASVELVWDPQWSQDMMSEEAQLTLGLL